MPRQVGVRSRLSVTRNGDVDYFWIYGFGCFVTNAQFIQKLRAKLFHHHIGGFD